MPSRHRFLPRQSFPFPGLNVIVAVSGVMILIQVWLDSMANGYGDMSVRSAPFYMALGVSWEGISNFRLWQFLTHALVHANWFHLIINLLMFWLVGGRVIYVLGQKRFAMIVLAGALAGGLLHVVTDYLAVRAGYVGMPLVGISGACMALLLTLTTLSPNSRMWPVPISGKNLGLGIILAELLLLLMTPELGLPVFSSLGAMLIDHGAEGLFVISHACHLGGALAGWFLARQLLLPGPNLEDLRRARSKREKDIELGDTG